VVIEAGPGRISLPMARVESIVKGTSPLESYRQRSRRLAPDDVAGWLTLALWAQEQGLATQARAAFERVAALDPGNATAQAALGNEVLGGRWVSREESLRARGYVLFEGSWVTPAEREGALAERAARARDEQQRAEADARIREAEARARTAEAEARRADSELGAAEGAGIPLWGSLATGFAGVPTLVAVCPVCGHRHRPGFCTGVTVPPPPPRPLPTVHPADGAGNPSHRRSRGSSAGLKPSP
jgi:hypothetical protein